MSTVYTIEIVTSDTVVTNGVMTPHIRVFREVLSDKDKEKTKEYLHRMIDKIFDY